MNRGDGPEGETIADVLGKQAAKQNPDSEAEVPGGQER